jgi:peptidoglycan/LPS O-acetylase OafA/YrhL
MVGSGSGGAGDSRRAYFRESWLEMVGGNFQIRLFRAVPTFFLGVTLGGAGKVLRRIPYPNFLCPIFTFALIWLGCIGTSRGILLLLVYLVGITGFACDVQKTAGRFINAVAPLGQLTYSIYLIQGLFGPSLFSFALERLHVSALVHNCLIVSAALPLLILSYLSFAYFETPARHWISSLGSRRAVPPVRPVVLPEEAPRGEIPTAPAEASTP